ncbi:MULTISPECIES: AraC family transcriptional regulator [unclassified Paenibacillus]|uniref:AraC family transcriptional regulator n=1 Tax=unclassified Paenibacillus TaxID=185978 RepID=UPI002406E76F|nr:MULTISPECIES: AraC family transcriptional regulator [unclassified Paenibacillus]MDF9840696.1 AraC family transcriptional activator of pobA [Paenibacillus sp. PastF-2]MDF9847279.1 AraC family transcriptional activator of pobA [Paenibacillus sp. PastM-2]MDF9853850.1 AraC family transcriptional activator of pobA [Paenibacillus sp. PastF-1]MDH6478664.1 AraC family transcriptional activator of pobA [Paenibacillus sp. PastH-2]MDH6506397.1 AraC family transcriptional activator of pobA [Paenibacill
MASAFLPPELGQNISEIIIPDVKTTLNLFGMHLRMVSGAWSYPIHAHPQYEFNYVLDGEQRIIVNSRSYTQRAGDLVLLRPGDSHSSQSGNGRPFTYFCIHFDIDDKILISLLSRLHHVLFKADSTIAHKLTPSLTRLVDISRQIQGDITMSQRMMLQSAVFELFGQLWEAFSVEANLQASASYEKVELAHQIRSRLQGLVYQQFKQDAQEDRTLGVDDIAAELGISSSHCYRVFRQVFGLSPREFLSQQMLHEAKVLLDDLRLPVSHISSILGYRDIAHFSRQFKRWYGKSPREYREGGSL